MTRKDTILNRALKVALSLSTTASIMLFAAQVHPAHAQYVEVESNGDKPSANVINLGTATSATVSGTSATNADADFYRINTSYSTPGIYVNQLQLNNTTQFIGSLRAQTQTAGVVNAGTDNLFQSSQISGTATPYGFNQYYSFGGAGKTQSMYYRVASSSNSTGGSYTATFTSTRLTPTSVGNFVQGNINLAALANVGSSNVATNTEIIVFDSNYNVYYDNQASSPTFGFAAMNDNAAGGFNLTRYFSPGTYYFAVGISNIATNDPAPPDDSSTSRSSTVLDFDNVIATNSNLYNGNNGVTRPSNFTITDAYGNTVNKSDQTVSSLYGLNFYSFNVAIVPEPGSLTLACFGGIGVAGMVLRNLKKKKAS